MKLLQEEELWNIEAINTHCHHLRSELFAKVTLHQLLQMTYVSWIFPDPGDTSFGHAQYFERMGANTYFTWWKAAVEHLYGQGVPLTTETWAYYDEKVHSAYKASQYDTALLCKACFYKAILLDDYKMPGNAHDAPQLMRPVFRCDMFLCGIAPGQTDENGNNAYDYFTQHPQDVTAYIAQVKQAIVQAISQGVVGLKIAIAYERSLRFHRVSIQRAQAGFNNAQATQQQRRDFSDYIMFALARIACELRVPIQIHTGLGGMDESRAVYLQELIHHNPNTKFDLFHASYPWCADVLGLAHTYPNVYVNLCWLPLISTARATAFLREALELLDAGRILWGCDTWTSEESYGARMALHQCLRTVLNALIAENILTHKQALACAKRLLHDNAAQLYKL